MIVPAAVDVPLAVAVPAIAIISSIFIARRDFKTTIRRRQWRGVVQGIVAMMLIAGVVVARLTEHVPNVAPVAAVALFAGAFFSFPWALLVPLTAMALSDMVIGFASPSITAAVYVSFAASVIIGRTLLWKRSTGRVVVSSLLSSSLFYLVTNFAVWKFTALYPPTGPGLLQSYYYAIPFFRMTVMGDMLYSGAVFAAVVAIQQKFWLSTMRRQIGVWYKEVITHS